MKPVAIFRHTFTEGPGYFATFLEARSIPWTLIAIDRGDAVPATADAYAGLCFMGGPMSVNDPLPWIENVCALIRDAAAKDIPVIGHCLGGQLMSKALGGQITRNPVKEIGWGTAQAEPGETVQHWLGEWEDATHGIADVFQWHGETFSLPSGATRLFSSAACINQAFVLGPHLAMQCHVEMTPEMIGIWCNAWPEEVDGLNPLPATVQTPEQMHAETGLRLASMRQLADQLYSVWIKGLKTSPAK